MPKKQHEIPITTKQFRQVNLGNDLPFRISWLCDEGCNMELPDAFTLADHLGKFHSMRSIDMEGYRCGRPECDDEPPFENREKWLAHIEKHKEDFMKAAEKDREVTPELFPDMTPCQYLGENGCNTYFSKDDQPWKKYNHKYLKHPEHVQRQNKKKDQPLKTSSDIRSPMMDEVEKKRQEQQKRCPAKPEYCINQNCTEHPQTLAGVLQKHDTKIAVSTDVITDSETGRREPGETKLVILSDANAPDERTVNRVLTYLKYKACDERNLAILAHIFQVEDYVKHPERNESVA